MDASPVIDILRQAVPAASLEAGTATDMPTIYVDREHLVDVCRALRDHRDLQFSFLCEVTAVDVLPAAPRFEVVYHLVCLGEAYARPEGPAPARRLRLKVRLHGDSAIVPTVTPVWPGAGWPEREVFDLFGIAFEDHPDLRRILTADDWEGHPLRKDYPVQVRKDTASWSPLQLSAEEFARNIRADRDEAHRRAQGDEGGPRRD
jgi:NADH-quinone oxidoreductase subunit C